MSTRYLLSGRMADAKCQIFDTGSSSQVAMKGNGFVHRSVFNRATLLSRPVLHWQHLIFTCHIVSPQNACIHPTHVRKSQALRYSHNPIIRFPIIWFGLYNRRQTGMPLSSNTHAALQLIHTNLSTFHNLVYYFVGSQNRVKNANAILGCHCMSMCH